MNIKFLTKIFLLAATLLSFTVALSWADELFSFKVGYQHLTPDGSIAVEGDSPDATSVSIENDLDLGESDEFTLEAALQLGSFRLSAAYLPIRFSGNNVLTRDIDFNGETFLANSHVKSQVDIDIYEAGIAWHLINVDDLPTRVQFGPELAVKYLDADIALKEDTIGGVATSESVKAAVPTIGLRGRVAIADALGIVGRVGYMEYQDSSFLDFDAQLEYSPLPMVGIYAGYRYMDVDLDKSDVELNATFDGPYIGALIRF